jgi:hypothetical protein
MFDTNRLVDLPLSGTLAGMLRSIADNAGQQLCISTVTFDEYYSGRLRDANAAVENARTAFEKLRRVATTSWKPPIISYPNPEMLVDGDLLELSSVFEVLPLTGDDAIEALRREARRLRPASTDRTKTGSGSRDVGIWLTALAWAELHDETVYLVSNDKKAFGAEGLDPVLAAEAVDRRADIILCHDVSELLSKFARSVDREFDLDQLLTSTVTRNAVQSVLSMVSFISASSMLVPGVGQSGSFSGGSWEDL